MSLKIDALRARYTAQKLEAIALLEVYMKNSVGIGEHPQIIDEMDKLVGDVESANGKLETLDAIFTSTEDNV
tara:strand:+ start:1378 stop:1593 length:216 start_codon:yes stop_codon:yes gene_type:complete